MNALTSDMSGRPGKMIALRALLFSTALVTFILVTMGFVVQVNDAAKACPDWPTCFGQIGFPTAVNAQLQVAHRWLAGLSALLISASFAMVKIVLSGQKSIQRAMAIGLAAVLLQSLLGAGLVLSDAPLLLSPLHLLLAMIALGAVTAATTTLFFYTSDPERYSRQENVHPEFSRLSWGVLIAILAVMISGALMSEMGAGSDCAGWPVCLLERAVSDGNWLPILHQVITLVSAVLMIVLFFRAWRSERQRKVVLTAASAAMVIMAGQAMLGMAKVGQGFPADLVILHGASAAALLTAQVIIVAAAQMERPDALFVPNLNYSTEARSQRLKDFILLNKPIIVLLLLVTTYAGMVVGGKQIPGLAITFWTLIGGALAAGGSSAINQYIDRDLDKAMQRTAKRPLPSGRLTPAEGLAYGVGAAILSFFLMASFVNLLSAMLLLTGIIYYVLLYSIWLKRLTVQNIVIGGGAGAIPPLVGWAAASGSLNIPSLFLFAIIFLWTPPHFWALALVRKNDYARAGVPMLPVVRGEKATRVQIFIYTLELVGLTLLMPIFKISGSIFLISAVVLGIWLISTAWRVLKNGGNKTAWKMYRYSSMYLAFLFLALVLDVLLQRMASSI